MDTDGNIRGLSSFLDRTIALTASDGSSAEGIFGLVLLFIIFVICGAYFGSAESAFSAMNKIRIKSKAEDGNKGAKNALYISNNFDRALTTLLIGNNIAHIASASIATLIATRLWGSSDTVALLCTIVTTLIVFLFSEMIPKSFANDRSETVSLLFSSSLRFFMKILYPFGVFFSSISAGITKLFSRFLKPKDEPSITEEELYDIIDTVEEEGVVNEEQGELLKSAMDFSGTHAEDVMTMRDDIVAVDLSLPNAEILSLIRDTNHSRLPVYRGDIDHIVGILHIRSFIRGYLKNPKVPLRSLLMPAFRVSPRALIDDLLEEMRQHKFYLGVVSDPSGKTLGIVSIEDFLEELVGEIWDEDDVVDKNFIKLGGNRFRINTHLSLREICERMGTVCPSPEKEAFPLIAIILEHFGRIPEEEETFKIGNIEFTIESVEGTKIQSVVAHLLADGEEPTPPTDGKGGAAQ